MRAHLSVVWCRRCGRSLLQWSVGADGVRVSEGVCRLSASNAPCGVLHFVDNVPQRRLSNAIFGSASAIFPHRCLSRD